MMPDLGKYATAVLSSYAVSLALLAVLVLMTIMRARKVKRELDQVENRSDNNG